jgi:hypothetical protein
MKIEAFGFDVGEISPTAIPLLFFTAALRSQALLSVTRFTLKQKSYSSQEQGAAMTL